MPNISASGGDAKSGDAKGETYTTIDNSMVIGGGASLTKRDTGGAAGGGGSQTLLIVGIGAATFLAAMVLTRK